MGRYPARVPVLRPAHAFAAGILRNTVMGGAAVLPSASTSTLTASAGSFVAGGVGVTVTLTARDGAGNAIAGIEPTFSVQQKAISAALSVVEASPASILGNGVETSTITVTLRNTDGAPVQGLDASRIVLAASGQGVTITQPSGVTNALGQISGTLTRSTAGISTVTATVLTIAISDTATVTAT